MNKLLLLLYIGLILSGMIAYFMGFKDSAILNLLMAILIKIDYNEKTNIT